jgi:integrase
MLARIESGAPAIDSGVTLKVFTEQWLAESAGRRRAESTVHEYRSWLTRHVLPLIGHKPMNKITIRDVEAVLDSVVVKGLSPASVKGVRNAMAALFADAGKDRVIASNPARQAEMPLMSAVARKRKEPTTEELRALLREAGGLTDDDQGELGRILTMCAHTGARIGEILGAKWSDINLDERVWMLARTTTKDAQGRLKVGDRTKTGEPRRVDLTGDLTATLRRQREFVAYRRSMAPLWHDEDWVFPSTIGTVRDSHNLRKLLKRTFPDWAFTFHGIRHWFVSMGLTASGAGLVQVSRLVGHRSTRTTQDVYGHLLDEGSSKVLDVVASALEIDRENG